MQVMEKGTPLSTWLERKRTFFEVCSMLESLAAQVHKLHAGGLVHRDLKPDNVLFLLDSMTWCVKQPSSLQWFNVQKFDESRCLAHWCYAWHWLALLER